ncbi:MAG: methionine gamma-lyase family protein [Lachnospiraceae bacterium]|nr:methionine gamma-lyase family protein [Lachnospiraceae bacterium]
MTENQNTTFNDNSFTGGSAEAVIYAELGISQKVLDFAEPILESLKGRFDQIDRIAEINQLRVIHAMQEAHVGEASLKGTTGYGYDDIGRDSLEEVYARYFHTEDALVRPQITCGTHALALALMSNLRPGQVLLSAAGKPYDTLEEVIGIRPSRGSLAEYGIGYRQVDLKEDGSFDLEGIRAVLEQDTQENGTPDETGKNKGGKIHLCTIQRSKGYQTRRTLSVDQIGEAIGFIKSIRPDVICMVDNCYGEFTETKEPSDVGADMVVGSLIKNPGGGLAPIGGYIAGTKECVENAACRLTSPGLGKEVGATLEVLPQFYQGFFMGPVVTASALKGAIFAACCYEKLGFFVLPNGQEDRHDIIQAITFGTPEGVIAFCQGIQSASPVDSFVACEPAPMPGYDSDVIMAAGAFVSGSSIELSADGPIKPPYNVYFQGGLTWPHAKLGILKTLQNVFDRGIALL